MSMDWSSDRGVYGISVAAELTGLNPQTLRGYEAKGLLEPARTEGGTRRYSGDDISRINQITTLLAAGLNLAGVAYVLELEHETSHLRAELDRLRTAEAAADRRPKPPRTTARSRRSASD